VWNWSPPGRRRRPSAQRTDPASGDWPQGGVAGGPPHAGDTRPGGRDLPEGGDEVLTCADQPVESRHMIVAFTLVRAVPRQQGRYHYGPPWPATIRLDRMTMDRAPSGS
jgi:hypothetical protein